MYLWLLTQGNVPQWTNFSPTKLKDNSPPNGINMVMSLLIIFPDCVMQNKHTNSLQLNIASKFITTTVTMVILWTIHSNSMPSNHSIHLASTPIFKMVLQKE
ncbi:hypothetical protein ACHAW6_014850 [Cyclotella cf. meneghiniana]